METAQGTGKPFAQWCLGSVKQFQHTQGTARQVKGAGSAQSTRLARPTVSSVTGTKS